MDHLKTSSDEPPAAIGLGDRHERSPAATEPIATTKRKLDFSPLNAPFSCPPRQLYIYIWRFCARCRGRLPPRGVLGVLPGGSSDALDRLPASKNRVRRVRMVQSRGAKMRYWGHRDSGRSWSSQVLISKQEAQGGAWGHSCENGVLFRAPRRSRSATFDHCQLGLRRSRHAGKWPPLV